MTVSTVLTLVRLPLTLLIIALLCCPGWLMKLLALGCFLLASFTDWLDGYLARQRRELTSLGALLDPIADKVLVLGSLGAFAWQGLIPVWMVAVIAAREVLLTGVRLWAARRGVVLSAERVGKWKTAAQLAAVGLVFLVVLLQELGASTRLVQSMQALAHIALWLAVMLTVLSGITFLARHRGSLQGLVGR